MRLRWININLREIANPPGKKIIEAQFSRHDCLSKRVWRDYIESELLSFKTEENAAKYDQLIALLCRAKEILLNVAIAEKIFAQYAKYFPIICHLQAYFHDFI